MAITFVTIGTYTQAAAATSVTPTLPASRVNNNLLIAWVGVNASGKTFSVGGGWTIVDSVNTGNVSSCYATRLVDGTEAAPVFTWAGAAGSDAQVVQMSGNQTVGIIGNKNNATANSSTTETVASITTTAANSAIFVILTSSASTSIGTPTNYTIIAGGNNPGFVSNNVSWGLVGTSGASSSSISQTIASSNWVSFGFEIVGPGGAPVGNFARDSQVVQEVLESYTTPANNARASQVVLEVIESYTTPIDNARVSQVVLQVLRTVSAATFHVERWQPGTLDVILNNTAPTWRDAFSAATMNVGLTNGNCIASDIFVGNDQYGDMFCDVSITLNTAAFVSPNYVGVYLYPANFAGAFGDGRFGAQAAGPPPSCYWVGDIPLVAASQTQNGTLTGIIIPPGLFRFVLYNQGGVTWIAASNFCQYRTYNLQQN